MTDLRKAAEMALKTLDSLDLHDGQLWFSECNPEWFDSVTTALRQALAQPEQEPFAYFSYYVDWNRWIEDNQAGGKPLYAAPPSTEAAVLAEREACAKIVEADGLARGNEGLVLIKAAKRIRARREK
jgi:hypothetical protein